MKHTHTPGPWAQVTANPRCVVAYRPEAANETICHCVTVVDARLIASAPALLDALQAVVNGWDNWAKEGLIEAGIDQARAAIRTATGED